MPAAGAPAPFAWRLDRGHWSVGAAPGAERVAVTVDGATAAEHDWVRGDEGTMGEALALVAEAPAPVTAVTRLTRSNFRSLDAIGALVTAADRWVVLVPQVPMARFDALAPRLAMATPWALRAVVRWGSGSVLSDVPLCLVGPHTQRVLPSAERSYGSVCASCPARTGCGGLDAAYLERFGGDELRARPSAARAPSQPLYPAEASRLAGGTGCSSSQP